MKPGYIIVDRTRRNAEDMQRLYSRSLAAGDTRTAWLALLALEHGIERDAWTECEQIIGSHASTTTYTHDGRTLTLRGWSEVTGISPMALRGRLALGWSVERTLTTPVAGWRAA